MSHPILSDANDILLAGIARKIQLSQTLHDRAVERYETIYTHLKRPDSPLRDFVVRMYPQGSMMIGSSISSKVDSDEFDIDLVLELNVALGTAPRLILDEAYKAIKGAPGSRYYDMTEPKTRCVTVNYADMHLDVTPAILLHGRPDRTSHIFHAKREQPAHLDRTITANPWGFGDWFSRRTPLEADLRKTMAMAEPVKEQEEVHQKSFALISLQLVKRWRNLRYAARNGRKPPSVLIAKLMADAATGRNRSLFAELCYQVAYLIAAFDTPTRLGHLIYVDNPACPGEDIFSDRWPAELGAQKRFLQDLREFQADLVALGAAALDEKQDILKRLFGEATAISVVKDFGAALGDRSGAGPLRHVPGSGSIAFGASGLGASGLVSAPTQAAPRHAFFGDGIKPRGR